MCPYVGASLYILLVPSGFAGRDGFDVNTSDVFPQGVLPAVFLVVGGAGEGGARARARCEVGLTLSSVANVALSRVGLRLKLLEQKP